MTRPVTALIADDEPLLRASLARLLARAWPELQIVAQARNGREAIELFDRHAPDVCFLDVQMPGQTGVEAAQHIGRRAHLVFVTAYVEYAVQAFDHGALDYLVKPVEPARLADTVARVRERVRDALPALNTDALIHTLAAALQRPSSAPLKWLRASAGSSLRLIAVDDVDYLRSDEKYTTVAYRDEAGAAQQAVLRTPLKDLLAQLDPDRFVQVHRAVVVNLHAISRITRGDNDTAQLHLKGRDEVLPVSRGHLHRFRQM